MCALLLGLMVSDGHLKWASVSSYCTSDDMHFLCIFSTLLLYLCDHIKLCGSVSQTEHFQGIYDMPLLSYTGMSYTVGKLRISPFQWTGEFVSMVAVPMWKGCRISLNLCCAVQGQHKSTLRPALLVHFLLTREDTNLWEDFVDSVGPGPSTIVPSMAV